MFSVSSMSMSVFLVSVLAVQPALAEASPDALPPNVPSQSAAPQTGTPQIVPTPSRFMVSAIDVLGVTKLDTVEIERAIYPYLGPDRTQDDVEKARAAVQAAYAAHGYEAALVELPPQDASVFAQGVVQLQVTEAPVGQVRVTGSKYHSARVVRAQVPSLVVGQPVDFKALQHDLGAANHFPDRSVTPSFKAGKTPGTIDVDLKVKDTVPLHGSVELDNDNSPNTKPLRLTETASYANLWQLGHTVSLTYVVAPQRKKDSEVISGSYTAPWIGTPLTFVVFGYKSNSEVAALGGSNVLGNGYQIGGRMIYRLPGDTSYQAFSLGLDYKDFLQNISINGAPVSTTPIKYIPASLGYSWSRSDEKSAVQLNLAATLGLRLLKRTACVGTSSTSTNNCTVPGSAAGIVNNGVIEDQFSQKDVDSTESFAHLNLDLSYTHAFKGDWVYAFKMAGQYADSHLVTNEQFAAGGTASVRGYYLSEISGDKGVWGSIELRTPSFATHVAAFVDELRLFGFGDVGAISILNPLPGVQAHPKIASVGGGARLKLFKHLSTELTAGFPLSATTNTQKGDPRITFSAKGEF